MLTSITKIVLLLLINCSLLINKGLAQNLVPNPSFEDTTYCPCITAECMDILNNWTSYSWSPDYYNACNPPSPFNGVPSNGFGYQNAATGNAYCGLYTYTDSSSFNNYRECIGTQLITGLTIGQQYYLSMKVSFTRADTSNKECSTNNLGMLLTTTPYDAISNPIPINNRSHLRSNTIISDSSNWTQIFGSFVADSSYQYVAVGNFYFDDSTSFTPNDSACIAYYYIDDICVSIDSSTCYDITNIDVEYENYDLSILIYPNPTSDLFNISSKGNRDLKTITIFNSIGSVISSFKSKEEDIQLSTIGWTGGIYFVQISIGDTLINKKIIISKTP